VTEALRLPDPETSTDMMRIARRWKHRLEERILFEPDRATDLRVVLCEVDSLLRIWDAIHTARCEAYNISNRRQCLKLVVDAIGPDAFRKLELPPAVPYWRGEP